MIISMNATTSISTHWLMHIWMLLLFVLYISFYLFDLNAACNVFFDDPGEGYINKVLL